MHPMFSVDLFVGKDRYGSRSWYGIPRVGDFVGVKPKEGESVLQVVKVVWLYQDYVGSNDRQHVDIYLKKPAKVKKEKV